MAKIVDIADQIYRELQDPTDVTIAAIAFWCRNNIGRLNSLINTTYRVEPTTYEFTPAMDEEERGVLTKMYFVYYYGIQVRTNLGAAGTAPVIEVSADGATVRKINKTTIAKDWMQLKREEEQNLKDLITAYKIDKAIPQQVHGDDNIAGREYPIIPDRYNYRNLQSN